MNFSERNNEKRIVINSMLNEAELIGNMTSDAMKYEHYY